MQNHDNNNNKIAAVYLNIQRLQLTLNTILDRNNYYAL